MRHHARQPVQLHNIMAETQTNGASRGKAEWYAGATRFELELEVGLPEDVFSSSATQWRVRRC